MTRVAAAILAGLLSVSAAAAQSSGTSGAKPETACTTSPAATTGKGEEKTANSMAALSSTRQRGEGEGLVAVALLNAEEPDALDREQLVQRRLNVGAHVPGKLPRCCDQPIPRDTGEVPFNRGTGKVKPLCFRDGAELL